MQLCPKNYQNMLKKKNIIASNIIFLIKWFIFFIYIIIQYSIIQYYCRRFTKMCDIFSKFRDLVTIDTTSIRSFHFRHFKTIDKKAPHEFKPRLTNTIGKIKYNDGIRAYNCWLAIKIRILTHIIIYYMSETN